MQILEANIEQKVVDRALTEEGVESVKLGQQGWPDRMFLLRNAPFFIEFKKPGEELTALQRHRHRTLKLLGYKVEVHDNVEESLEEIRQAKMGTARIPKKRD